MAGQREIAKEQILYLLINLREEEAKRDVYKDIVVNKEACKEIGIFNYKVKGTKTSEERVSTLFLISETQDGEKVNLIYDEKGRFLAWESFEKNGKRKTDLEVASDVELNKELLKTQIALQEEKERNGSAATSTSAGSVKSGEGRNLPQEQKEEEKQEKSQEDDLKRDGKEENKEKLPNLKNEINMDHRAKIPLDQIINGYALWQILQLEEKLSTRLPEGMDEAAFRTGYLSIVDSKELQAKDGKERKSEDTFIVSTYSGDIVELDDQILQPMELGGIEQRKQQELNRQRYEDGEEAEKPDAEFDTIRTSLYKIPDANSRFAVAENWFLSVDWNRDHKEHGQTTADNVTKNISFVQVSRNESYYGSEEQPTHTLEYKLDPIRENTPKSKQEIEKEQELRENKPDETLVERKDHMQELVDKCFAKYEKLGDYYNRGEIGKKVRQYHNQGMDDEEVIEQIGEDAKVAEEVEHEFHIHGRNRHD